MRFLLYNIRYATALKRPIFPWSGYLSRKTNSHLDRIINFIDMVDPDVAGLVEVDGGSFRSKGFNHSVLMGDRLDRHNSYQSKYSAGTRIAGMPILKKQGNAFLTRDSITNEKFHYFDRGFKRLVMELELEHLSFFLVHLALGYRTRQKQLATLSRMIRECKKPVIVAGDFNLLWGEQEIDLFLQATNLQNANGSSIPTFPSWRPKRHLDFILHSPEIKKDQLDVPSVQLSDHLPMVFDFSVS